MRQALMILLSFFTVVSYAQRAIRFSIKPAYSFTMVTKDLEDNMNASGFGDDSPPDWFSNTTISHPRTKRLGVGAIAELEVMAQKKLSFSIGGGIPDWGEVDGYDHIGIGNYLFIEYATWMANATLNYHYSSHKASIGPALAFFKYKDTQARVDFADTEMVGGISLANSFFSKKNKKVKVGLFFQANVFPNVKTKEIIVSHEVGISTPDPVTFSSTFKPADINISNLQVGLCVQF